MYTWTRKEIAEAFEVSVGTVSYWTKVWGPESDHSFPLPVAKLATGTGPHQRVYDPGSVQVWWTDLPAAKTRRMSKAQTGVPRPRKKREVRPVVLTYSTSEMREALDMLVATRNELAALREAMIRYG
jgi:hypothetical protein